MSDDVVLVTRDGQPAGFWVDLAARVRLVGSARQDGRHLEPGQGLGASGLPVWKTGQVLRALGY